MDVRFAATGASNLSTTLGGNYTINTLSVGTPGVSIAGANTLTVNSTGNLAIYIYATNGTTAISANLAGATAGLTKAGAGTLTLSGNNTFGGGLALTAGTLNSQQRHGTGQWHDHHHRRHAR
jgi:autotransporter-associated beta strand protein